SFCLLGVATPSDLIQDTRTTPFNIGKRIELNDFTEAEAAPLAAGLIPAVIHEAAGPVPGEGHEELEAERSGTVRDIASSLLNRILYWTGGHPYLTQRLCRAVAEAASPSDPTSNPQPPTPALVDRLCEGLFLSAAAREKDDNLLFVR